jgi:2-haloacid dehalogenase
MWKKSVVVPGNPPNKPDPIPKDTAPMIDTIIFDLGNVLIPWNPHWLFRKLLPDDAAINHFLHEINFSSWNTALDGGQRFAQGIEEKSTQYPHYRALLHAYFDRWDETVGPAHAEPLALMRELKAAGYRVLALTNFSSETFPRARALYPFLAEFEGIVVSGEVGLLKPDPAIYELLCKRYDVKAAHAVFIDDSAANTQTAIRLGMHGIHLSDPHTLRTALRTLQLPV